MPKSVQSATFTIDDLDYSIEDLSDEAKLQIKNIEFSDAQILQLTNEWAISKTARSGYLRLLNAELNTGQKQVIEVPDKFELEGVVYNSDQLSASGKGQLHMLQFVHTKVSEIQNQRALLEQAKIGYIVDLKKEILASKGGLLFDDN